MVVDPFADVVRTAMRDVHSHRPQNDPHPPADSTPRFRGICADPTLLIAGRYDQPSGEAAARLLLERSPRPDAIMCSNDDMAAGLIAQAHRAGLRLPHDLAVTGFDDTTLAARIWPPLTTVRQPAEDMAFRAAEQLIGTGDGDAPPFDLIVPHAIVERESTSCPPASP